jgi:DNA mismatch endonuclease (patch repair protein)
MSAVRSKNSQAEVLLRRALWSRGVRYRLHVPTLPGTPDIVVVSAKAAIFVDGDFWHGRILIEQGDAAFERSFRTSNSAFWIAKIRRNLMRDLKQTIALNDLGWSVLRIWEKDILREAEVIADQIAVDLEL